MRRALPDYANVTPEDITRDCRAAVQECDAGLAELVAVPAERRTFGNTVLAVEEARAAVREAKPAYRRMVLERGGTVDAEQMVREFLGRDPSSAAFLRGIGLTLQE